MIVNSSRRYLARFLENTANALNAGAYVLDAGAGDRRYQPLFTDAIYHSTDVKAVKKGSDELSFIGDLGSVPLKDDQYDLVICTQVLEHVKDPGAVLLEIFRVLREGGQLLLTAPLYYEEHEAPNDFFRFTRYGITQLLESAGFKIRKVEWLEGYFGTLSYELDKAARSLPLDPRKLGNPIFGMFLSALNLILKPTFLLLSIIFAYADIFYKYEQSGNCKNYVAIAVKPTRDRE
jgi:SAM-dependent methyltransferase